MKYEKISGGKGLKCTLNQKRMAKKHKKMAERLARKKMLEILKGEINSDRVDSVCAVPKGYSWL